MAEETKKTAAPLREDATKGKIAEIPLLQAVAKDLDGKDFDEARHIGDQFVKIAEMRISFFEKIILLAGGSFALSVTFLGSIQRHNLASPIRSLWVIEGAWVLLFASISTSWLHNRHGGFFVESIIFAGAASRRSYYQNQRVLLWKRAASAFESVQSPGVDLSEFFQTLARISAESSADADKIREQMVAAAKETTTTARKLGDYALLAIAFAFLLMLIFAVRNASLL
jgi:hypothetical protein